MNKTNCTVKNPFSLNLPRNKLSTNSIHIYKKKFHNEVLELSQH